MLESRHTHRPKLTIHSVLARAAEQRDALPWHYLSLSPTSEAFPACLRPSLRPRPLSLLSRCNTPREVFFFSIARSVKA